MGLDLINIIFGMKVRQARLEAGLTLADLSRLSELSPSYLTEIEKGRKYPRADKIVRLAEAFAEWLHRQVRTEFWGYAPDEPLDHEALVAEKTICLSLFILLHLL